ncbi:MAG: hypothetical protein V9F03_06980 [Microthrixaceae bacterium]
MAKTSVEIDRDLISEAAEILGTGTLRDTIDAALREVVNVRRRLGVLALLADNDRFDLAVDGERLAWGRAVTRSTHLVDTSAFARINQPLVAAALESLAMEGCLALCAPTIFELGYGRGPMMTTRP